MTVKLGLTGSIGMGKSTTAGFFREFGVPVWDADAEVHALYSQGGQAVPLLRRIAPAAIVDAAVDRDQLKQLISQDKTLLSKIETALKPLLAQARQDFLSANHTAPVVVFDIPLLYETDTESWLDYVLVVTAPENVQKQRVLSRNTMDEALFNTILSRQMSDIEKRALADYVFDTSKGMDHTKADVKALIKALEQENA
jgi:dephospho-CoA kinase